MPYRDYNQERAYKRNQLQTERKSIISLLGSICIWCGFSDVRALQIDHVYGGGTKESERIGRGMTYLRKVRDSFLNQEGRYQLLCANCNSIKRHLNNEFPWAKRDRS